MAEFINLFFDKRNRRFFKISEKNLLSKNEIDSFVSGNGTIQKTPDGGLIMLISDARIYRLCNKWVVCYRQRPITVKTNYSKIDNSRIIVYADISKELSDDLSYHTSYDGNLPCWRYG